jgi:hypothetical protein
MSVWATIDSPSSSGFIGHLASRALVARVKVNGGTYDACARRGNQSYRSTIVADALRHEAGSLRCKTH